MTLQTLVIDLPNNTKREFSHRGGTADFGVIDQIFGNQDYSFDHFSRGAELFTLFDKMKETGGQPLIVDAGSNIGASIVWFAHRFPGGHIVGFEPDAENFDLLRRNTSGLDVDLFNAALGSRDGRARTIDPGEGHWGYRTEIDPSGETPIIGLSGILARKRQSGFIPYLVKIDIEGGESELFSRDTDWIDDFPILIIELHDWLMPGQRTAANFLKAVASRDRDFIYIGENIFSVRN